MKNSKVRLCIVFTFILVICLGLPCIAHAAPDLSGVINQANNELSTTLNPIPKYGLPIFYIILVLVALFNLAGLIKEYLANKNDDHKKKEISDKIISVLGISIGIAVLAPLAIIFFNTLFGTHFVAK